MSKIFFAMDTLDLVQVAVVHRHGARSPISTTSSYCQKLSIQFKDCGLDVFQTAVNQIMSLPLLYVHNSLEQSKELNRQLEAVNPDGCFYGQLTHTGKQSLLHLGHSLRQKYVHSGFLSKHFDPHQVVLRSTNYVRTIESLQFLFHGLYPKAFRPDLPVFVNVRSYGHETMAPNYNNCPALTLETLKVRSQLSHEYAPQIDHLLSQLSHLDIADDTKPAVRAYRFYDLFTSLQGNGLPLPSGVNPLLVKELEGLIMKVWGNMFSNDSITSKSIGRFLPEWTHHAELAVQGKHHAKMAIFSGHDSTIQPLLGAMQVIQPNYPGYASHVHSINLGHFRII